MTAMTEPTDEPQATKTRGCLIPIVALVLIGAAITVAIKLWPESSAERRDKAIDVCKSAVNERAPTPWAKLWQESSFDVDGFQNGDGKNLTVTGKFATKDSGFRSFTCRVNDDELASVQVQS